VIHVRDHINKLYGKIAVKHKAAAVQNDVGRLKDKCSEPYTSLIEGVHAGWRR
jgi:hypothetical protein